MIVFREFIVGITLALDLRLDDRVARDGRKMVERPAGERGPMIDDAAELCGPVRLIMVAIEGSGLGVGQHVERETALGLERKPLLVGEQPILLRHPRRLPPEHRRHRVLGEPIDLIFRRCRRDARIDEARMERGIIVPGGETFGEQRAFVGLGHLETPRPRSTARR